MKPCKYIKLFSHSVFILLIIFVSHGCQRHISQAVANQIADTELAKKYQEGFLEHQISDAQLKNVDVSPSYWIFTYTFKNSPGYRILITVDNCGNVLNTAFGTPEWP